MAKLMFDDCLALSGVVLRHGLGRSGLVSFSRVSSLRTVFVVFAVLVVLVGASMATTPIPISSLETPSTASDVGTSVSASPSPSYPLSRPSGHPKKSPVWDYFLYDVVTDKSVCQVEQLDSQSICGKSAAGKFATNLKKHLKLAHPSAFEDIVKKEEEKKEKNGEGECKTCGIS